MERRSSQRCPVCQGPAKEDDNFPEGLKCRNSTCQHNFADVTCPRCSGKTVEHVTFKDNSYHLTCGDCQNHWQISS